MNVRTFILPAAMTAVIAAGGYHWKAIRTQSRLEAERARVLATAAETRRLYEETSRQVAAAQSELQATIADRMNRSRSAPASGLNAQRSNASPAPRTKSSVLPSSPELRRLQIQAFVSEQRLRFAEVLKRLHFTPENRQAFDRIHGAYQEAMLANFQTDVAREQARHARDAQLQELFGANHDQWIDANRNQPARAIVAQIVQQTFQSSGALTTAQADELTRIVAQHRIQPPKQSVAGLHYDWDQIISDAHSLLDHRQREAFVTAIEYRRASEKMSAIAAGKKQ
jgi:hypothetical protein